MFVSKLLQWKSDVKSTRCFTLVNCVHFFTMLMRQLLKWFVIIFCFYSFTPALLSTSTTWCLFSMRLSFTLFSAHFPFLFHFDAIYIFACFMYGALRETRPQKRQNTVNNFHLHNFFSVSLVHSIHFNSLSVRAN